MVQDQRARKGNTTFLDMGFTTETSWFIQGLWNMWNEKSDKFIYPGKTISEIQLENEFKKHYKMYKKFGIPIPEQIINQLVGRKALEKLRS